MPHQTAHNDQGLDDSGNKGTDAPESVSAKCAVEPDTAKARKAEYMKNYMAKRRAKLKAHSPKPTTSA